MLVFALLASLPALPQEPGHFRKPQWGQFVVPVAVDHVAVMAVNRGWGPPGEDKTTIIRSGYWQREVTTQQDNITTTIVDVRTGRSLNFTKLPDGRYRSLTIGGTADAIQTSMERTGESDRALGEACSVWAFKWKDITEKSCLTSDGIMLWHQILGTSGHLLSSARAISVA